MDDRIEREAVYKLLEGHLEKAESMGTTASVELSKASTETGAQEIARLLDEAKARVGLVKLLQAQVALL